jgi:putative colanic acid biosynthesis UDP-glucose lipid carrier transferase
MLGRWESNEPRAAVTAAEPSVVFVAKSLLYPVVAVLTLIGVLLIWDEPLRGPYLIVAVLTFIGVADCLEVDRVKKRDPPRPRLQSIFDLTFRWFLVVGFTWGVLYIARLTSQLNNNALLTWAAVTPFMLWVSQILIFRVALRHLPPRRAVVVGLTELGLRLESKLREDPFLCTEMLGFFDDRAVERLPAGAADKLLGKAADLRKFVLEKAINVVYITLPMNRNPRILALLESLHDSTVSIYFAPDVFMFNLVQSRFDLVNGIPVVAVRESPFYGVHGVAKRSCDVIAAASILLLMAPLFAVVAIGVWLSSPGPILFKQKRYGLDGKPIMVYKFRSMTVTEDGESHYTQVARNDSRVTRFGSFIRRNSLDEIPQLLNVLGGTMSLVGPRPHAVAVNEQYRRLIPSYMTRHKVKPGITGWAQINGYRGGDDLESMSKRIDFDLEYLSNWSLRLDIIILFKTAVMVWGDRRAY